MARSGRLIAADGLCGRHAIIEIKPKRFDVGWHLLHFSLRKAGRDIRIYR